MGNDAAVALELMTIEGGRTVRLRESSNLRWTRTLGPVWPAPDRLWIVTLDRDGDQRSAAVHELRLDLGAGAITADRVIVRWPDANLANLAGGPGTDRLAVGRSDIQYDVIVSALEGRTMAGAVQNVTRSRQADRTCDWLPDGRVVFMSDRSGGWDLYAQRPGEPVAVPLTEGPALHTWAVSLGPSTLLYWEIPVTNGTPTSIATLVRLDTVEGTKRRLFDVPIEGEISLVDRPPPGRASVTCARERAVCFLSTLEEDRWRLRAFDPETGDLGDTLAWANRNDSQYWLSVAASPDGRWVGWPDGDHIALFDTNAKSMRTLALPPAYSMPQYVAWFSDSRGLYVTALLPQYSILSVPLDGTAVPVATDDGWLAQPAVSWDGTQLAWLKWIGGTDIVVLSAAGG
jgi:hypothetical protein